MNDKWKVLVTVEVERLRPTPQGVQVLSKQVSTWGAVKDTPGEAYDDARSEGLGAYLDGLPRVTVIVPELVGNN